MNDYCLALELNSKWNYEHLREYLVLPNKRKLQYMDKILKETFASLHTTTEKYVLLVDEVQIPPNSCIF